MADEADRADEQAEQTLRAALLRRLPAGPVATGLCLWCGVEVSAGVRWCHRECRDDYERRATMPG